MPSRRRRPTRLAYSAFMGARVSAAVISVSQNCAVERRIRVRLDEIVERPFGDADEVIGNEPRAFSGTVLGILQTALPFEHRPAVEFVAGKLREDGLEVDLAVAWRAESPGPLYPRLEAAIDSTL